MKVKIRFIEGRLGGLAVLEVATPVDHPLLRRVPLLVEQLGLKVGHQEQQRGDQRVVYRWLLTESDGSALDDERRNQVQALLLEEIGSTRPPSPSSSDFGDLSTLS